MNERGGLMMERITKTVSVHEIVQALREVSARKNVNMEVITIDNVPLVEGGAEHTKLVLTLKEIFQPKLKWVAQDRFHVHHNISPEFNNQDPRYFPLTILNFRHKTTRRDADKEEQIDQLLTTGKVAKKVTFGHAAFEVKLGECLSKETIAYWKEIGVYHEMFSTNPYAVVPEYVKSPELLNVAVQEWFDEIKEKTFDASGAPIKDPIKNTILIASLDKLEEIKKNALIRIKNCHPPTSEYAAASQTTDQPLGASLTC